MINYYGMPGFWTQIGINFLICKVAQRSHPKYFGEAFLSTVCYGGILKFFQGPTVVVTTVT